MLRDFRRMGISMGINAQTYVEYVVFFAVMCVAIMWFFSNWHGSDVVSQKFYDIWHATKPYYDHIVKK